MTERAPQITPTRRDRAVRRVRRVTWAVGAATAGLATTLSVVAAHAFKGHSRNASSTTAQATAPHRHHHRRSEQRVAVPGPQRVPAIASGPRPLQPPSAPPSQSSSPSPAPAPAPQPQPQTSGGS